MSSITEPRWRPASCHPERGTKLQMDKKLLLVFHLCDKTYLKAYANEKEMIYFAHSLWFLVTWFGCFGLIVAQFIKAAGSVGGCNCPPHDISEAKRERIGQYLNIAFKGMVSMTYHFSSRPPDLQALPSPYSNTG
jgi:hypothetical protein